MNRRVTIRVWAIKGFSSLSFYRLLRLLKQHAPQTLQAVVHSLPPAFFHLRFNELEDTKKHDADIKPKRLQVMRNITP